MLWGTKALWKADFVSLYMSENWFSLSIARGTSKILKRSIRLMTTASILLSINFKYEPQKMKASKGSQHYSNTLSQSRFREVAARRHFSIQLDLKLCKRSLLGTESIICLAMMFTQKITNSRCGYQNVMAPLALGWFIQLSWSPFSQFVALGKLRCWEFHFRGWRGRVRGNVKIGENC